MAYFPKFRSRDLNRAHSGVDVIPRQQTTNLTANGRHRGDLTWRATLVVQRYDWAGAPTSKIDHVTMSTWGQFIVPGLIVHNSL